jgi:hypothetical protein
MPYEYLNRAQEMASEEGYVHSFDVQSQVNACRIK